MVGYSTALHLPSLVMMSVTVYYLFLVLFLLRIVPITDTDADTALMRKPNIRYDIIRCLLFSFLQQMGDKKIIRLSIAASNLQLLPSLFENIQVTINM